MWQQFKRLLEGMGQYTLLILDVIVVTFRRPPAWALIREQMYSMGFLSIGVIAITGFATGLVMAAQSFYQLSQKGFSGITGIMVAKSMITELGPLLTGFMITGRVGAAICAELGSMKVTEQVDALRSMAINPNRYLIAPRFIAFIITFPFLTLFMVVMGIFGGYLLSVYFFDMVPMTFTLPIKEQISSFDLSIGIVKSILFGALIATISCYKGLKTSGGAEGVGRMTTNSVVTCYAAILILNFLITFSMTVFKSYFTDSI